MRWVEREVWFTDPSCILVSPPSYPLASIICLHWWGWRSSMGIFGKTHIRGWIYIAQIFGPGQNSVSGLWVSMSVVNGLRRKCSKVSPYLLILLIPVLCSGPSLGSKVFAQRTIRVRDLGTWSPRRGPEGWRGPPEPELFSHYCGKCSSYFCFRRNTLRHSHK